VPRNWFPWSWSVRNNSEQRTRRQGNVNDCRDPHGQQQVPLGPRCAVPYGITLGYARLHVSTLLDPTVRAWCCCNAVVASVSGHRCEAPLRGDHAIGATAKPATAQLPAAGTTAVGAAPFARSYARASITHRPLLRRQQCLPVIATGASGTALHVRNTERSLAGSSVDPAKSRHLRQIIAKLRSSDLATVCGGNTCATR
jgi:hypothetical protein